MRTIHITSEEQLEKKYWSGFKAGFITAMVLVVISFAMNA